jgi:hypothetical protein
VIIFDINPTTISAKEKLSKNFSALLTAYRLKPKYTVSDSQKAKPKIIKI